MLTPPDGLPAETVAAVLAREWGLYAAQVSYRPVGWGSHHWEITEAAGDRWFVTADELENKRVWLHESLDAAFGRLTAALAAATDLRAGGCSFVVAPVPTQAGEPLARAGDRFGLAVYPFVDGRSFPWGKFSGDDHRRAITDLVIAVHTAPQDLGCRAMTDDFTIPHRDELEAVMAGIAIPDSGPYARRTAALVTASARPVRALLDRYDRLAGLSRPEASPAVLTHGEPHPANTMLTDAGWLLIDWDTALVAPPERDLWALDPGDGSVLARYAEATGVTPVASALDLYRIRWDLTDLAIDVSRFRRPHSGTEEDDTSWELLRGLVERISS